MAFSYALLDCSGWGVGVIAFTHKHDGKDHVPSTQIVVAALAIGPKENEVTIACCLSTFIRFYFDRGVDVMNVLRFVVMDGTHAGKLAAQKARGFNCYMKILHFISSCRCLQKPDRSCRPCSIDWICDTSSRMSVGCLLKKPDRKIMPFLLPARSFGPQLCRRLWRFICTGSPCLQSFLRDKLSDSANISRNIVRSNLILEICPGGFMTLRILAALRAIYPNLM